MNRLIDYSSRFRILKGGKISLVVSALLTSVTLLNAAPQGGVVTSGQANIVQNGKITDITQATNKASINWNNFSINSDETVNFKQPNASSITLNRVIGNEKSVIDGALNANGQVWLLNSNGVLFSKNAKINTAGILASTKNISDADFQAGRFTLSGSSTKSVINEGTIEAVDSSYVIFAANEVKNSGTIKAVKGKVHLVGADQVSINLNGNSLVNLTVDKGVLDSLVENSGKVYADGGDIYLTTNAVGELLKGVVNNTGVLEANSLDNVTGNVELFAHGGTANISGTINATDGSVETSGKTLSVKNSANITAKKWLLDPTNVTIDSGSGTVGTATVGASVIENALSSANVTIEANNDITINSDLTNNSQHTLVLTADADDNGFGDINVNAVVTVGASAGLTLDYGTEGNLIIQRDDATDTFIGKINLATTSIVNINDLTYTVINTLGSQGSTTRTDLQGINGNLTGNYVLGADISASDTKNWNSNTGWTALGDKATQFTGNFNGLGHTVDSLYIKNNSPDYQGLFGYTSGATIKNVGVTNADITAQNNVGALVGTLYSSSSVSNSYSTGTINSAAYSSTSGIAGGLVGFSSSGTILNSYSKANVNSSTNYSSNYLGGLVGYSNNGTISNSYTTGGVSGSSQEGTLCAGGLVGYSMNGTISNSYATKDVSVSSQHNVYAGGLIGYNNAGDISNSYATGNISATVSSSVYSPYLGGLVGYSYRGTISNSYASSSSITTTSIDPGSLAGLTTYYNSIITNSYYDNETNTGTMVDSSTYGKTKAQISSALKDLDGWSTSAGGSSVVGYEVTELPYLTDVTVDTDKLKKITLFNSGTGTSSNAFSITNWNQLQNINYNSDTLRGNYFYTLSNNLLDSTNGYTTLASSTANSNAGWTAIGNDTNKFTGTFDGDNHIIDNLYINTTSNYAGLFGYTDGATIQNIGLTNVDITGGDKVSILGGLVGYSSSSTISNAYSTGSVTSGYTVAAGGLVGLTDSSTVSDSYSKVNVTGGEYSKVGGLVGNNYSSTINNAYATGSTTGGNGASVGGLIGLNNSSTVTKSYYDSTVNAQSNGIGYDNNKQTVTALTSTQMAYGKIYADAGWDIVADNTVTSSTPVRKYDNINDKYYWAIAPIALNYTLNAAQSTYNGLDQTLNSFYTTKSIFGDDYIVGDTNYLDGIYSLQVNGSDVTSYKNAGVYKNIKVALDNDFVTLASTGNTDGTLTINKADATVTADNKEKTTGEDNPALTYKTEGLISGDSLIGDLTTTVTKNSIAGTYDITQGTLANNNYNINFTKGILTVNDPQNSGGDSTPTNGGETNTPTTINGDTKTQAQNLEKILTPIVNQTIVKVDPVPVNAPTVRPNVNIPATNPNIVSTPNAKATKIVTLSQLKQQNGNADVRVPLGQNSLLMIVNNGVNLPNGVDQEFYVNQEN